MKSLSLARRWNGAMETPSLLGVSHLHTGAALYRRDRLPSSPSSTTHDTTL
jgi:hypothetical protein